MRMNIRYERDGKELGQNELVDALVGDAADSYSEEKSREIEQLTCHEHGEHPRVRTSRDGSTVRFDIEGCCDALIGRGQELATQ